MKRTSTSYDNHIKKSTKNFAMLNSFEILKNLILLPGQGQTHGDREEIHKLGKTRSILDPMMWSHIFFIIASYKAWEKNVLDLFIINTLTTILSIAYHCTYEKPGRLAAIEGLLAKGLFFYGCIQLMLAPSRELLLFELLFFSLTVMTFLVTNIFKELYNRFHIYMHVFPAIWAIIVALYHRPLIIL